MSLDSNGYYCQVAGALDSAWRAVDQFLVVNQSQYPDRREEMHKTWGSSEYWDDDKEIKDHIRLGIYHGKKHDIPSQRR